MPRLLTVREALRIWKQRFGGKNSPDDFRYEKEPWRVFREGMVPCLAGEAARMAFDRVDKRNAVYFRPGGDDSDLTAELFPDTDAAVIDCMGDLYIIDRDFAWTYVHTRYPWYGPYFVRRRAEH